MAQPKQIKTRFKQGAAYFSNFSSFCSLKNTHLYHITGNSAISPRIAARCFRTSENACAWLYRTDCTLIHMLGFSHRTDSYIANVLLRTCCVAHVAARVSVCVSVLGTREPGPDVCAPINRSRSCLFRTATTRARRRTGFDRVRTRLALAPSRFRGDGGQQPTAQQHKNCQHHHYRRVDYCFDRRFGGWRLYYYDYQLRWSRAGGALSAFELEASRL